MRTSFFVLAAVFFSFQLQAQNPSASKPMNPVIPEGKFDSLEPIVVTAFKSPQRLYQTGKVMTLIDRVQLEKNAGKSLGEILNTAAGTTIIGSNGVAGTNQTVSIRGASAGNVLILINGSPLNDPSVISNYFDLNFLSVDQIERIEILKGGQSTLYGSDAVAGVINIILRTGKNDTPTVNGNFSGGSYSSFKQSLGISRNASAVNYSLFYSHNSSKGFSAAHDALSGGTFDNDGFDEHSINGRVDVHFSKKLSAGITGMFSVYKTDLDASAFTDEQDYTVKNNNRQAGLHLRYNLPKGGLQLQYSFNRVERNYLDDSTYKSSAFLDYSKSNFTGRTHFAELTGNFSFDHWDLLAGVDYRWNNTDQDYFSTGPFGPYAPPVLHAEMNQLSSYVSAIIKTKSGFRTELGGRLNHHSVYGDNFSFTFNPFFYRDKRYKLFGNMYSAFKTPTLYQLFDPSAGNRNLDPERSLVTEAGAEIFAGKKYWFRLTGFYRTTKDAIIYTFNPLTYESIYRNAAKQSNYGFEWEGRYHSGKFNITANYTYTDGKTTAAFDGTGAPITKDTTYYNLYRIPKHAVNATIGIDVSKALYTSLGFRSVSGREEFIYGAMPKALDGYFTIDIYGEYRFNKKWKCYLDLKNITNKEYFDILGYNARRFNFTAGLSFQLGRQNP